MLDAMDIRSPADLTIAAQSILARTPSVVALVGPLGAGKTTLTQALARAMGVAGRVTSPTYVLQQVYRAAHPAYSTLVHVDAYRLRGENELPALDIPHWATLPRTLVVVEWADRIAAHLKPHSPLWVRFTVLPSGARRLTIRQPRAT